MTINFSELSSPSGSSCRSRLFSRSVLPLRALSTTNIPHGSSAGSSELLLDQCDGMLSPSWSYASPSKGVCLAALPPLKGTEVRRASGFGPALTKDSSRIYRDDGNTAEDFAFTIAETRCRTVSDLSDGTGLRYGAALDNSEPACTELRSVSTASDVSGKDLKRLATTDRTAHIEPLPNAEIEWLMGTLAKQTVDRFNCHFFLNDCQRRFQQLDACGMGKLGMESLQHGLVDMFPTLMFELRVEGHHIPALGKSIPALISTFDSDEDGYLEFDDFVNFIKFQRAWREQFFLSKKKQASAQTASFDADVGGGGSNKTVDKPCSLPRLGGSSEARRGSRFDGQVKGSSGKRRQSKSSGKGRSTYSEMGAPKNDFPRAVQRPSDAVVNALLKPRYTLDASCGAFYSSFVSAE